MIPMVPASDGTATVIKPFTYLCSELASIQRRQTHEKTRVTELLRGLCDGIAQPHQGRSRPRLPLSDVVFSVVMKVFGTTSGRRAASDLREREAEGLCRNDSRFT